MKKTTNNIYSANTRRELLNAASKSELVTRYGLSVLTAAAIGAVSLAEYYNTLAMDAWDMGETHADLLAVADEYTAFAKENGAGYML